MANPNDLAHDGYNTSQIIDKRSTMPPTQVITSRTPPTGSKSMSIAALDAAIEYELRMGTLDPNMDKKQMRRIVSNRYAAKKAHDKKVNKMVELENHHKELEGTIATLRPKIEHEQHVQSRLSLEKAMMVQQLQIFTETSKLQEAEISKKLMERERLIKGMIEMQPPPPYNFDVGPSGL